SPARWLCAPRPLEPWMLIGSMVDNQLRDHVKTAAMRLLQKSSEIAQVAVRGVDAGVMGDIVAVILERGRIEREQPQGRDSKVPEVVELLGESAKVTDAVAARVEESPDVKLVDDRVLIPLRILGFRNFPVVPRHAGSSLPSFDIPIS